MTGGVRRAGLVARREWDQRVRSRAFAIATHLDRDRRVAILVPDIVGSGRTRTVGLVGQHSPELPARCPRNRRRAGRPGRDPWIRRRVRRRAALRSDDVAVVLVDQHELVWKSDVDDQLGVVVTEAVQSVERRRAADELGLTPDQVERVLRPTTLTTATLEPGTAERTQREELAMDRTVGVLLDGDRLLRRITSSLGVVEEKS